MRKAFLKKMREKLLEMRAQLLRNTQSDLQEGREQTKDEGMDTYDIASDARDREISLILNDRDRDKAMAIDGNKAVLTFDFAGPRAILDNRFKLVVDATKASGRELFDVRADPAETTNVIAAHPEVAQRLEQQLRTWQQSVLTSLTGADYR